MFKRAEKSKSKLRLAVFGASGSGKTYSALRMASGMGKKIAFIDSERGSASLYADKFDFDVCDLERKDIDSYVNAIRGANGYDVLVIDSLSHAWAELLQDIDRIAKAKYRGNTWSAWSEGTPKQRALVDALLSFDGHVIATMRCKTEWIIEQSDKGKGRPVRVGLAPEQGKGIEYEFSLLMEISPEHLATVIKDRTGKFQDKVIDKPDEAFGKSLLDWLSEGKEPDKTGRSKIKPSKEKCKDVWDKMLNLNNRNAETAKEQLLDLTGKQSFTELSFDELIKLEASIDKAIAVKDDFEL